MRTTLPDITKAAALLVLSIVGAVAEFEAAITKERAADSMAARLARGDRLGAAPYGALPGESVEPIIAAYRAAGSCYGAARALNAAGSRTRRGALWTSKVIGEILQREGVTYRRKPRPGAKADANWATFQLLTCHCGQIMTTMDPRSPRVTCYRARHDPDHPARLRLGRNHGRPGHADSRVHREVTAASAGAGARGDRLDVAGRILPRVNAAHDSRRVRQSRARRMNR